LQISFTKNTSHRCKYTYGYTHNTCENDSSFQNYVNSSQNCYKGIKASFTRRDNAYFLSIFLNAV